MADDKQEEQPDWMQREKENELREQYSIDTNVDLTQCQCYCCGGKGTVDTKSISPGPLCPICKGKGTVDD